MGLILILIILVILILYLKKRKKKPTQLYPGQELPDSKHSHKKNHIKAPKDYVVFDLETTGFNKESLEVLQIGALKVSNNVVTDQFMTYVKPLFDIPAAATNVNHITYETVKDAPGIKEALLNFLDFAGDGVLIGYNIGPFDIPIIKRDAHYELGKEITNDYVDVLPMARRAFKNLDDHHLSTIAKALNINADNAHDALFDCNMTMLCYEKLKERVDVSLKNSRDLKTPRKKEYEHEDPETEEMRMASIQTECPDFCIKGKTICLSGSFELGESEYVEDIIQEYGGILKKHISSKVDYLIMGNISHHQWKYGKYGTKLKDATELNEKGANIKIISEEVLIDWLNHNNDN